MKQSHHYGHHGQIGLLEQPHRSHAQNPYTPNWDELARHDLDEYEENKLSQMLHPAGLRTLEI